MYWTGRYFERSQALARAVLSYQRLSLDSAVGAPLDLAPLLGLVGREPDTRAPVSELFRALVLDPENPSSVRGALGAARENLRSGRTLMPPAVWEQVSELYARLGEVSPDDTARALGALEEVEAAGSQVEGQLCLSMTRDAAYSFFCIGSRLERADMLLRALLALVPRLAEDDERHFSDVRWGGLLECVGAYSMFRRRHQTDYGKQTLLSFLLTERDFPRSLAHLVSSIERELEVLPRPGRARAALARCVMPAHTTLDGGFEPLAERLIERLEDLHEVVAETYFPPKHGPASAHPPASLGSRPPARDPFENLGRDHAVVDAVLRLLDELAARAACAQAVDRSAVSAIVDFFTDFGVLGHHEKEESILMPVLLENGFDWHDGPLAAIRRDHRQEHYFIRVLDHLSAQSTPWSEEDKRHFASVGAEFSGFLRAHMRLEQCQVFEPGARRLSASAKTALLAEFARFDAQSAGGLETAAARLDSLLVEYGVALRLAG
jgi:uncharacterized alpha-E superfamily protein/hemerythrin-like domain-containing protein